MIIQLQHIILLIVIKLFVSYENYYEVEKCLPETCPYPSLCLSNTICKCKEGFYNINEDKINYINKCNYKMKSSNTPFWIEIITNIGIGHMIIGNYKIGIFKLFFVISSFCFFYYACMSDKNSLKFLADNYHLLINFINVFLCLGVLIWWVIDTVCFGFNIYKDNNGIKLYNY